MRQVFQSRPWVHQEEPEALAEVFRLYGVRRRVPKGYVFLHGSERGEVNYLVKGIAFFAFVDSDGRDRIFAVLPPKRVIGDLDALTEYRLNVIAVTSRPCEVLTVPGEVYRKFLRSDPKLMELYAVSAVTKEESHMEGLFANYTLPLEQRLHAEPVGAGAERHEQDELSFRKPLLALERLEDLLVHEPRGAHHRQRQLRRFGLGARARPADRPSDVFPAGKPPFPIVHEK